jgi:hypothetical protein
MDVNEHEGISNFTLRQKFKLRTTTFIASLHFMVTVGSSIIGITHVYLKMSVKQPLACSRVVLFTYVDKYYIWTSL